MCAGVPSMFLSQEIVGSALCQFNKTTLADASPASLILWLALVLAGVNLGMCLFSFCRPQLQSWQKSYTKCEYSSPL